MVNPFAYWYFQCTREKRDTRLVSRDGGNLPLSGTVGNDMILRAILRKVLKD